MTDKRWMVLMGIGSVLALGLITGCTGRVWYHNWHGQFMDMRALNMHN